jgi:hypothetical protein
MTTHAVMTIMPTVGRYGSATAPKQDESDASAIAPTMATLPITIINTESLTTSPLLLI